MCTTLKYQKWFLMLFFFLFICYFASEVLICVFTGYLAASNHSGNKSEGD